MPRKIAKWLKTLWRRTAALSIEQAQREWETALDAVQELIFIHDADLCIVRANRAYAARAGKDIRDIIGKPYWTLFPKLDGPLPGCRRSLEERQGGEEALRLDSGEEYLSRTYPIYDAEGRYLYSLHVMQDVTAKRKAEAEQRTLSEALRESEEKFRQIATAAQDAVLMMDNDGRIAYWNAAAERIFGHTREEALGKELHAFLGAARYYEAYGKAYERFRFTGEGAAIGKTLELAAVRKDGTEFPIELSVSAVRLGDKWSAVGILRDITERKRMEGQLNASLAEKEELVQSLHELATRDGLTGLYNHRAFYELLEDEIARATRFDRPVSLLMLDIDHFKHVNDSHGHLAGDAALKGLGEVLGRQARAIDRVCRYGGEEITVILPETGLEAAGNVAERLRATVEAQPFDVNAGAPLRMTVSIGVASFPAHAGSAQALVGAADAALYAAKQGGRNRISRHEPAPGQAAVEG